MTRASSCQGFSYCTVGNSRAVLSVGPTGQGGGYEGLYLTMLGSLFKISLFPRDNFFLFWMGGSARSAHPTPRR